MTDVKDTVDPKRPKTESSITTTANATLCEILSNLNFSDAAQFVSACKDLWKQSRKLRSHGSVLKLLMEDKNTYKLLAEVKFVEEQELLQAKTSPPEVNPLLHELQSFQPGSKSLSEAIFEPAKNATVLVFETTDVFEPSGPSLQVWIRLLQTAKKIRRVELGINDFSTVLDPHGSTVDLLTNVPLHAGPLLEHVQVTGLWIVSAGDDHLERQNEFRLQRTDAGKWMEHWPSRLSQLVTLSLDLTDAETGDPWRGQRPPYISLDLVNLQEWIPLMKRMEVLRLPVRIPKGREDEILQVWARFPPPPRLHTLHVDGWLAKASEDTPLVHEWGRPGTDKDRLKFFTHLGRLL